jgi:NSS family neurotransmitter:Na+ symporter
MPGRDQWGSNLGFVLAAAGSAIGLGNLWKFPYITWHNEGGAFVLVYLLCIAVVGFPIMVAEIMIGRRTQKSAVGAMREAAGERWAAVGGLGVIGGFVILSYYSVVAGWALQYFVKCLGWSNGGYVEGAAGEGFGALVVDGPLQITLAAIFLGATAAVILAGVGRGIERVARVLMPLLFVILLVMLVTALRMEGAGEALAFIFRPNFSELPPAGILEALGHSFFTLSLGMGAMITYGSYLQRKGSVASASMTIVLLDTLIAIVATVIMFSVIFSVPGIKEQIGKSTAGMLFVTLPNLFYTDVPFGSFLGPLFYILVSFAALTSTISLLEVVVAYFIDEHNWPRPRATLLCTLAIFAISITCALSFGAVSGLSSFEIFPDKKGVFDNLDHLASNWILPVGGLFITLAAGYAMTRESSQAELVDGETPGWFNFGAWRLFIRFVAPAAVAAIIIAVILGRDFS